MKVNEIIQESQLNELDWRGTASKIGNVATQAVQGVKGAVAGYQASKVNRANAAVAAKTSDQIARITNAVLNAWAVQIKTLQNAGAPVTLQNFVDFMKKEAPSLNPPQGLADADVIDPAKYTPYIKQSIAQHFTNRQNAVTQPTTQTNASQWQPARGPGGALTGGGLLIGSNKVNYSRDPRGNWLRLADPTGPQESYPPQSPQAIGLEKLKKKLEVANLPTA